MNKTDLVKHYHAFIQTTDIDPEDARVDAGGALLLWGLRTQTGDIDLTVSPFVYDALVLQHALVTKTIEGGSGELAVWNEVIDLHPGDTTEGAFVDGVWVATPASVLAFKREMNREKDQADIQRLIEYLN